MLLLVFAVGLLALSLPASVLGQQCQQVGVQCAPGCGSVIYCISIGDNSPLLINSCTPGTFCTEDSPGSFSCSATSCNGGSGESSFICLLEQNQAPLLFPDPYNISNSFVCTSSGSFPVQQCTCPEGQCFSTVTQCTPFDSNNSQPCGRDVPLPCPSIGRFQSLTLDFGYYYTCDANGARLIRKCSGANEYFDSATQICQRIPPLIGRRPQSTPKDLGNCGAYIPPGEGSTTPTPTTTTSPTPTPTPLPTCLYFGQEFPTEFCNEYYICNQMLLPVLVYCAPGQHYNQTMQGCVLGECSSNLNTLQLH